MTPGFMAMVLPALGNHEKAVVLLEMARARCSWLVTTLGGVPLYGPFLRDPRSQG